MVFCCRLRLIGNVRSAYNKCRNPYHLSIALVFASPPKRRNSFQLQFPRLGGYDASRIVGSVSSQLTNEFLLKIDLHDIGIGVDHGRSPLSSLSPQGLLNQGKSSLSNTGISVTLNPSAAYLYLPSSTCAAIPRNLPATYDAGRRAGESEWYLAQAPGP